MISVQIESGGNKSNQNRSVKHMEKSEMFVAMKQETNKEE